MRRLFSLMLMFGVLTMLVAGCHHTAGVCDCDSQHGRGELLYPIPAGHSVPIHSVPH